MARRRQSEATRGGAVINVLFVLAFVGFAAYAVVLTVDRHGQVERSDRVQGHGQRVPATIESERVVSHHHKGGTSYDSLLSASLSRAVEGRQRTTVHVPYRTKRQAGDRVTVALDPRDASYAEFVGTPYRTSFEWIGTLVAAVVLLVIAGFLTRVAVRTVVRYRRTAVARTR